MEVNCGPRFKSTLPSDADYCRVLRPVLRKGLIRPRCGVTVLLERIRLKPVFLMATDRDASVLTGTQRNAEMGVNGCIIGWHLA